ncbi:MULTISPECIES: DUF368 domain-containing protein [Shouchella]|uniref:DUF368 domain-containing protein n=2 Tax=Shouchella TaxID=2893057 RepID=A0ABY7W190_9BACI|nr:MULTISPECIES: DUF368 domain-containing protein [Shouchella]MED4130231.1 DUF368 domain-containing protein [Shouchella miscanthi]WDF02702.1 DUF368 domain-containing protein [Shouchella hunanensis]
MFKWTNFFRGFAMGVTETVPGVSASTIAMLMGIYEQLLGSLSDITKGNIKRALGFLIPLGIGMVFALLIAAKFIKYLLAEHPIPTMFLFVGLVVGILPFLWRSAHAETNKRFKSYHYGFILVSFTLMALTSLIGEPVETVITDFNAGTYIYLFFSGVLASMALVLPGISGALVLMVLGAYYTAISALDSLHLPVIAAIGLGVVFGVLFTSRVIRYFLKTYTQATYSIMLGLVAGSILVIMPSSLPDSFLYGLVTFFTFLAGLVTALTFGRAERT